MLPQSLPAWVLTAAEATAPRGAVSRAKGLIERLARHLWRFLRLALLGNAVLAGLILVGGLVFHWSVSRGEDGFQKAISWSTKYILTPGLMVEEGDLPAEIVLPIAHVIEKIFIRSIDFAPARDAHQYLQGRLLQPMAATYGKMRQSGPRIDRGQQAVAIFADLAGRDSANIEYRRRLARSHQLLGEDLATLRRHEEAMAHFRAAALVADGLLLDQPGHWRWRWYQAMARLELGTTLAVHGQPGEAGSALGEAHRLAVALRAEQAPDGDWQQLVARIEDAQGKPPSRPGGP